MLTEASTRDLRTYYKALGDDTRLRILQLLATEGEHTVSAIALRLRLSQPLLSWHLRRLRELAIERVRQRAGEQDQQRRQGLLEGEERRAGEGDEDAKHGHGVRRDADTVEPTGQGGEPEPRAVGDLVRHEAVTHRDRPVIGGFISVRNPRS